MLNITSNKVRRNKAVLSLLFICAIFMFIITSSGVGISPDSSHYIGAARSILALEGITAYGLPLTHFPPAYPILLAGMGKMLGGDVLLAARVLAALLFAINTLLFSYCVSLAFNRSVKAFLSAALLFVCSQEIIVIHAMAWSGPLFIALSLGGFLFFSKYITGQKSKYLILASILIGIAVATRYVGLSLIPPIITSIMLLKRAPILKRIKSSILFLLISLTPILMVMVRNKLIAGSATNREFSIHAFGMDRLREFASTLSDFLLPIHISNWAKIMHLGIVLALVIVIVALNAKRFIPKIPAGTRITLMWINALYALSYIALLVISISFFDAATPLDARLLLPVFLASAIAVSGILKFAQERDGHNWIMPCAQLAIIFSVSINALPAAGKSADIYHNSLGYAKERWTNSEAIAMLNNLPDGVIVFSNFPGPIYCVTNITAKHLPIKNISTVAIDNLDYDNQLVAMASQCNDGKAVVIIFPEARTHVRFPARDAISILLGGVQLRECSDGIIYHNIDSLAATKQKKGE